MTLGSLPGRLPTVVLQSRGIGVLEALRGGLPGWAVELFAVATHLGDTAVLLALAALIYVVYDRRAGAFVLGTLFVGFAVIVGAKAAFALPRPPSSIQAVSAYGFGFPSGHAVGATVGWGAMALTLDRVASRRRRTLLAGAVIAVVAVSRVAIGVHYLVDVIVGIAVGLAVLGTATRWGRDRPAGLFAAATGLSVGAVALSGGTTEALALSGGCVGALLAWQLIDPDDRPRRRQVSIAAAGVGILLGAALGVGDAEGAMGFGVAAIVTGGLLYGVPLTERRLGDWR